MRVPWVPAEEAVGEASPVGAGAVRSVLGDGSGGSLIGMTGTCGGRARWCLGLVACGVALDFLWFDATGGVKISPWFLVAMR